MTTITQVINSFDQKSKDYENFLQQLIELNGDIPFNAEEVDSLRSAVIAAVNSRLNQAHTRCNGLIVLDKILPQCSKDILIKYSLLWLGKATHVLESVHSSLQDISLSCKVIGSLLVQSKRMPEIYKQVSMQNVKQLINIIIGIESQNTSTPIFYLIAVLLYHYPEVCERFQVPLKNLIISQIDSTEDSVISASAKCYALLVKATERSFKPPAGKPLYTNWVYNQGLICNSLHNIMDELFSNLIELQQIDTKDKLDLPSIPDDDIIKYYSIYRQRFINLCSYLSTMLCGSLASKNSTLPQDILQLLCRGLAITPLNVKKRSSFKEQMLYLMIPKLHTMLLTVLESLINGFKGQLIPFGSTIMNLFHLIFQWTDTVFDDQATISGSKPFKCVRISLYKCLVSWLVNTNSMSGIETVADDFLPSILKDIVPERDRVLLSLQKTQNLSKRALKRFRDSQYEKGVQLNNTPSTKKQLGLDVDISYEALIALQNIFFSGGAFLSQTFFKAVQNILVPLLYDCYLSSSDDKFYKENTKCRLQLLRTLRSLQMSSHPLIPNPTQYLIELFELALCETDMSIIHEAKIALAEIEKIIHPVAPTLQLVQVENIPKEFISAKQNNQSSPVIEDTRESRNEEVIEETDVIPASKRLKTNATDDVTMLDISEPSTSIEAKPSSSNQTLMESSDDKEEDNTEMNETTTSTEIRSTRETPGENVTSNENTRADRTFTPISNVRNLDEDNNNNEQEDDHNNETNRASDEERNVEESKEDDNSSVDDEDLNQDTILQLFCDELKEDQ